MRNSIRHVLPDAAVRRALEGQTFTGRVFVIAIGKAAWRMAREALRVLDPMAVAGGAVVTKYRHAEGELVPLSCYEAGHPVPDENTFSASRAVMRIVSQAGVGDTVLFLVSGGGSALFEVPAVSPESLQRITSQLLASGADIHEINAVRKHLSQVKGGRFAQACAPAKVFQVVLSDVIGNDLDVIASGPAVADSSTSQDALKVCSRYGIALDEAELFALCQETPKTIYNVETVIAGGVETLCQAAAEACATQGFQPVVLTSALQCEAKDAGAMLAQKALDLAAQESHVPTALIAGGETVVQVKGCGKGGRSQELAMSAAKVLEGSKKVCLVAFGSDGTDGPTDAAGGFVDGESWQAVFRAGLDPDVLLENNDSYQALCACGGLLITGPTGTNVNDVAIAFVN